MKAVKLELSTNKGVTGRAGKDKNNSKKRWQLIKKKLTHKITQNLHNTRF